MQQLSESQLNYYPSLHALSAHHKLSDRYAQVRTMDVIKALGEQGFFPVQVSEKKTRLPDRHSFVKHCVTMANSNLREVGDVAPRLLLTNSHDGSSSYSLGLGLYRCACANGLVVSDGVLASYKARHSGSVADNVVSGALELIKGVDGVYAVVEKMKNMKLDRPTRYEFTRQAAMLRFGETAGEALGDEQLRILSMARRNEDVEQSVWNVYNSVQESFFSDRKHRRPRIFTEGKFQRVRQITGIDQGLKLNKALFDTAMKFAA